MSATLRRRRLPALAKHVIETMRDGLAVHDSEGRLLGWNPGARAITGWSAAEAEEHFPAGLPLGDSVIDLAGQRVAVRRFDLSERGEHWIITLFSLTETAGAGEPQAAPPEPPQPEVDVEPAADPVLGELPLLDASGAMVIMLDAKGRVTGSNRTCRAASGFSAAELAGQPLWETLVTPDQAGLVWAALDKAASGTWARLDCTLMTRSGERRFVSWSIGALPGPGQGSSCPLVAVGIDVTQRQLVEEALAVTVAELDQEAAKLRRHNRALSELTWFPPLQD